MADTKISALTAATTPLAGTEVLPIVQGGVTKKVSVADLTAGRAVSMDTLTTTGKGNFGNSPAGVIGRADVAIYFANRASNATTANLFVATTNALGADIGGGIAMGGYVDATNIIPLATWSGRKVTSGSGNYAGYALLTISDAGGGTVDTWKVLSDGSLRQLVAGSGVNFLANSAAAGKTSQLLNYYEEGTWTPTITRDTPPTLTYTAQIGKYVRIGRQVTLNGSIFYTVTSSGGGLVYINGFPFTGNSTSSYSASGSVGYCDSLSTGADAVYCGQNATGCVVAINGGFAGGTMSTGRIYFTITYQTD